MTQLLKNIT